MHRASFRNFTLVFCLSMIWPWPHPRAEVFLEAKLVVNLLPGVNQTDPQIQALVDRVNAILDKCPPNMALTLAPNDINRLAAFPAGFDHNGNTLESDKITKAEREAAANPEIAAGGYKIYVADKVTDRGRKINGGTFTSQPISLIQQQNGLDGDGQTWAHELVHGLGRDGESKKVNQLMFEFRKDAQGNPAGTDITQRECGIIFRGFIGLSPQIEVTVDQDGFIPADPSVYVALTDAVPIDLKTGDPIVDRPHLQAHAARFFFSRGADSQELEVRLDLSGVLPRDRELDSTYTIFINADNDASTGIAGPGIEGVDATVELGFQGVYPFGRTGRSFVTVRGVATDNEPMELADRPGLETVQQAPDLMPSDNVLVTVPLSLLGETADTMEVVWSSAEQGFAQTTPPQQVPTRTVRPELSPGAFETPAGGSIAISGSGFAANSRVDFYWDNSFGASLANFATDAGGGFSGSLAVPETSPGSYYLDAIDADGGVDIAVVTVAAAPAIGFGGLVLFALGLALGLLAMFLLRRRNANRT